MNSYPHRKMTMAELHAEAKERFGDDPINWAFVCPSCGDVATGQDFALAGLAPASVGQECIGRGLDLARRRGEDAPSRGCTRAAYGLIAGPWEVVIQDRGTPVPRSIHAFPLAPAPVLGGADQG